ncbi:leukocyte-associated immunoglobulin-like receptor 2 [Crocuta crocuta]
MSHQPVHLLGLLLCLGQGIHTQKGILPRPSIWAEPASVVPWGQPVTVRCRSPAEAETSHLEKEGSPWYQGMRSPAHGTEAGFPISAANEDTAGLYRCLYYRSFTWSESSEALELVVTVWAPRALASSGRHDSLDAQPSMGRAWSWPVGRGLPETGRATDPKAPPFPNYTAGNYIRLSLAGVVLLILMAILAEAWYSQAGPNTGPNTDRKEGERLDPQGPGGTSPGL